MNERDKLAELIEKLSASLRKMQADPRRNDDIDFENAIQHLHKLVREQRQRLTDMATENFRSQVAKFGDELDELDKHADNFQSSLDKANTTAEVVGAVEQIVKFFNPAV